MVLNRLAEQVRSAAAKGTPLRLRGGGSKDFYGQSLEGELLDLGGYAGIVEYDPTELVVTARCGTRLAVLEAELAARGQMLAFEPPHFGPQATIGGAVAAGLSGPRRSAAGALRDFVLGIRLLDGRADALAFGGKVMKNVAGYDVSRAMAGSLGVLGPILEVSLKTSPLPPEEITLRFELPEEKALDAIHRWSARPLPISASAHAGDELLLRLSGAGAAVRSARNHLGGEMLDAEQGRRYWNALCEQTDGFFSDDLPLWRVSVPSATPPLALAGRQLIEWGGALRWVKSGAEGQNVREAAARAGGHATLFRGCDKSCGVFQPLDPVIARFHRNLKKAFDPAGIFNRGRMYPDL